MKTINQTAVHAEQLIEHTLTLVTQLHEQIVHEAEVLTQPAASDLLRNIAEHKQQLAAQLETLNHQLIRILADESLPADDDGMMDYFNRANIEHSREQWRQITSLSSQCRLLNDQNGITLNMLTLHTQRSLQILKGQSQISATYSKDGSSQHDSFTRSLSMA